VLCAVAAVSAIVAGAIPAHRVDLHRVVIDQAGKPLGPGAGLAIRVSGHRVVVHPPAGWSVVQVGEGDASHAHVNLTDGSQMVLVLFHVPVGARDGQVVGERDGAPIRLVPPGARWRSPDGIDVFVAGPGTPTPVLVDVIMGLAIS
jgi:hypothetical protein